MIYRNRSEAGKHLAAKLKSYADRDDVLVLALPQVKMHFRYSGSRPETQASDGEIPERWPGVARRTNPAEQLIDRLAIEKAVRMLPPGYRTTFILHDIEGYKHEEAARLSGHTAGTSKSQLHKARANLRAVLAGRSPALQT